VGLIGLRLAAYCSVAPYMVRHIGAEGGANVLACQPCEPEVGEPSRIPRTATVRGGGQRLRFPGEASTVPQHFAGS
jgi:hypothetical protein